MLSTGQLLSHYCIVRLLKSGGMGEVYLADDMRHHRAVAIKVIRLDPTQYADAHAAEEAARLFLREAQTIAQLDHPHILPLYDSGEEYIDGKQLMYMVMPFRHEGALPDWLHKHLGKAHLPLQAVEYIVRQTADALQHAHAHGIIHQDIKLSNFLILGEAQHPSQLSLQLADFGVAKFVTTTSESQVIRGTPTSMAPEQWEGHAVPATDQYALAVMAYELLTGRSPFAGTNAQQLWYQHVHKQPEAASAFNPHVPKALNEVLLRALAKHPKDRFPSILAFAQAFRQAIITSATIYQTLTISAAEARNGTNCTLMLAGRQPLAVSIPAGAHHNQVIRLMGQGTPTVYGGPRGDLILTLHVNYAEEEVSLATAKTIESTVPALAPEEEEFLPPRRRSPLWQKVLLVSITLLLIATSTSIFYTTILHKLDSDHPPATVDAKQPQTASFVTGESHHGTSTAAAASAIAATAQANAIMAATTATAQAQATANTIAANPFPSYLSHDGTLNGSLVLLDPLSDSRNGYHWTTGSFGVGKCDLAEGSYHVSTNGYPGQPISFHPCFAQAVADLSNFAYEVDMTIIKGDCGGLIFRSHNPKLYYFYICQNGWYGMVRYTIEPQTAGPDLVRNPILRQGSSQFVTTGQNLLAVVANGNTIELYVNQHLIDKVDDSTYSNGEIGVLARSIFAPTEVIFNNVRVWTL